MGIYLQLRTYFLLLEWLTPTFLFPVVSKIDPYKLESYKDPLGNRIY